MKNSLVKFLGFAFSFPLALNAGEIIEASDVRVVAEKIGLELSGFGSCTKIAGHTFSFFYT